MHHLANSLSIYYFAAGLILTSVFLGPVLVWVLEWWLHEQRPS
jgi:uncharacterized Tic20 family protein